MDDGLIEQYREKLREILSANPRVVRAVLFGSRAMGTYEDGSDIDLALFGEGLTTHDLSDLSAQADATTIPQIVDFLLFDHVSDERVRAEILKHGVEWYRAASGAPRG